MFIPKKRIFNEYKLLRLCRMTYQEMERILVRLIGKTIFLIVLIYTVYLCIKGINHKEDKEELLSSYGVFLSLEGEDAVKASEGYKLVVVDAQVLSKEEILFMQDRGQQVYTYLNIGSLEMFRPYFEEFHHLIEKPYQDWEDEYWINVSSKEWQRFIEEKLVVSLLEKNVDGFWIDNVDVYSQIPTEAIYLGVEAILKGVMTHEKPVIVNSGNEFVELYAQRSNQVNDILTGVNQETVFSTINFEDQTFGIQTEVEQNYYIDYLNAMEDLDKDVFLLEYTRDNHLEKEIQDYAKERGWNVYISNSIELNGK